MFFEDDEAIRRSEKRVKILDKISLVLFILAFVISIIKEVILK